MMTYLLIAVALGAAGLLTELIAASTAPVGYQDENGFHFGVNHLGTTDEVECGNPS